MRIIATIAFYWVGLSAAAAIVVARMLRSTPPPLPDDYLADQPVDVWSDTRIDAEFWALVWPYEVRS